MRNAVSKIISFRKYRAGSRSKYIPAEHCDSVKEKDRHHLAGKQNEGIEGYDPVRHGRFAAARNVVYHHGLSSGNHLTLALPYPFFAGRALDAVLSAKRHCIHNVHLFEILRKTEKNQEILRLYREENST